MKAISAETDPLRDVLVDVGLVAGFIVLALALASLTLSRRSA
jgi:ABC-2 type transport system permease protein